MLRITITSKVQLTLLYRSTPSPLMHLQTHRCCHRSMFQIDPEMDINSHDRNAHSLRLNQKKRNRLVVFRLIWITRWSKWPTSCLRWHRECMPSMNPESAWQILTSFEVLTQIRWFPRHSANMSCKFCPPPACPEPAFSWVFCTCLPA